MTREIFLSICLLIATSIAFSNALTCYRCMWMGNDDNCMKVNDQTPNNTLSRQVEGQIQGSGVNVFRKYCVTVTGIMHMEGMSHSYGDRLAQEFDDDVERNGVCENKLPPGYEDAEMYTEFETCYCSTDKCNNKEFTNGASEGRGLVPLFTACVAAILIYTSTNF